MVTVEYRVGVRDRAVVRFGASIMVRVGVKFMDRVRLGLCYGCGAG